MTIRQKIEILCEINHTTVNAVEKEIGISKGSVSKWDEYSPASKTMLKLAQYFHVTPESLIDQSEHIELADGIEDKKAKIAELTNLLELLDLSEEASEVAKDMLISIKKNIDKKRDEP